MSVLNFYLKITARSGGYCLNYGFMVIGVPSLTKL